MDVKATAREWVASPFEGEWRVRVFFRFQKPLTSVLAPGMRGEARKAGVSLSFSELTISERYHS
jgi:hypothetical protein